MTLEERVNKAVEYKHNGCNCTQSVLMANLDLIGMDQETALKLSSGFCQGMGGLKATCGALIGAGMVAGIINDTGLATKFITKEMLDKFEIKSGATICGDLKGIKTKQVLCSCDDCIRNAIIVMDETLKKYKK